MTQTYDPTEVRYLTLWLSSYHHRENSEVMEKLKVLELWDEFEESQAFEEVGLPQKWQKKLYQAKVGAGNAGAMHHKAINQPPDRDENGGYVLELSLHLGDPHSHNGFLTTWANYLEAVYEDGLEASGDDTFYDYHPDLWRIAEQVAWALKDSDLYPAWQQVWLMLLKAWSSLIRHRPDFNEGDPDLLSQAWLEAAQALPDAPRLEIES